MRALCVVDPAPVLEGSFGSGEIDEWRPGQHFGFEAAMEAFVLAHGLRMIGREWLIRMPCSIIQTPRGVYGLSGPSPHGEPLSVIIVSGRP